MTDTYPNFPKEKWLQDIYLYAYSYTYAYTKSMLALKGGEGSGNFGHAGRPGEIGGSAMGGGSLSENEISAVSFYKEEGYSEINSARRSGSEYDKNIISAIDSAISKNITTEDKIIFRGVSPEMLDQFEEGGTFSDSGYISASENIEIAENFGIEFGKNVIMEIELPKGSNALLLDNVIEAARDEKEYLLPRGSNFTINSIEEVKNSNGKIIQWYVNAKYAG